MYRNFKIYLEDKPLDQLMLFLFIKTQEVQHKVSLSLSLSDCFCQENKWTAKQAQNYSSILKLKLVINVMQKFWSLFSIEKCFGWLTQVKGQAVTWHVLH